MPERVLIVDDDPLLLASLRRQFRRRLDLDTAASGEEGIRAVRERGPFAVVVTDYCMPRMNGVEFLKQVRQLAPETVRVLLTGSADLNAAVRAVNEGNIFRFLLKPCPAASLQEVLEEGFRQFRRTRKERKFSRRTRRWLAEAMEVQQGFFPSGGNRETGLDIAGRSCFCDPTGGDYYDYFDVCREGRRRVVLAVGDVSDHGLPSALLMASARAFLREAAAHAAGAAAVVSEVNRQFSRDVHTSGRFMTLFYAEIEPDSRRLTWVRAGHEPAWLYDPEKDRFEDLAGEGGLPLGVLPEAGYAEYQRGYCPGEILLVATDGIWEAQNREGACFGKAILKDLVRAHAHRGAAEILGAVLEELERFLCPLAIQDDATLLVARLEV